MFRKSLLMKSCVSSLCGFIARKWPGGMQHRRMLARRHIVAAGHLPAHAGINIAAGRRRATCCGAQCLAAGMAFLSSSACRADARIAKMATLSGALFGAYRGEEAVSRHHRPARQLILSARRRGIAHLLEISKLLSTCASLEANVSMK